MVSGRSEAGAAMSTHANAECWRALCARSSAASRYVDDVATVRMAVLLWTHEEAATRDMAGINNCLDDKRTCAPTHHTAVQVSSHCCCSNVGPAVSV